MATQHDSTAPACEALAAWDKLFNEREALNQYLDCSDDAAYHEPEGKLPAETVRALTTAATLLEHVNTLIDKANECQARRPGDTENPEGIGFDENNRELVERAIARLEFVRDTIGDMASASDDRRLEIAAHNMAAIEHAQERLAMLHNEIDLIRESGAGSPCNEPSAEKSTRVEICDVAVFDRIVDDQANKSGQECAARLRQFAYDVSENLAASATEDEYTVTRTWTLKGLRHFVAECEFMERLLSGDDTGPEHDIAESKHLRKVDSRIAEAKGVAETLRCALLSDDYDPEPFADVIAGQIVDLLGKAQASLDRHSMEAVHGNSRERA